MLIVTQYSNFATYEGDKIPSLKVTDLGPSRRQDNLNGFLGPIMILLHSLSDILIYFYCSILTCLFKLGEGK